MIDMRGALVLAAVSLALVACGGAEAEGAPAQAQPETAAGAAAAGQEQRSVSSFTAEAVFSEFERGDHLYAVFEPIAGREAESVALVQSGPLAAFLQAHKGKPLTVKLETVNMYLDPPGERVDQTVLREARTGTVTADAWWAGLSADQRQAAERAAETSGPPAGQ